MAKIIRISPYADDQMNLPVADVESAVGFYTTIFGFSVEAKTDAPCKKIVLRRDDLEIAIAENGGDPSQEGCFFEVDNVEEMFGDLQSGGYDKSDPGYRIDQHGETKYKVFFVIAPDGLCYCIGERQP